MMRQHCPKGDSVPSAAASFVAFTLLRSHGTMLCCILPRVKIITATVTGAVVTTTTMPSLLTKVRCPPETAKNQTENDRHALQPPETQPTTNNYTLSSNNPYSTALSTEFSMFSSPLPIVPLSKMVFQLLHNRIIQQPPVSF